MIPMADDTPKFPVTTTITITDTGEKLDIYADIPEGAGNSLGHMLTLKGMEFIVKTMNEALGVDLKPTIIEKAKRQ